MTTTAPNPPFAHVPGDPKTSDCRPTPGVRWSLRPSLRLILAGLILSSATPSLADQPSAPTEPPEKSASGDSSTGARPWKSLEIREGAKWVPSIFGGDGEIKLADGVISLGFGDPLTGVRWEGDFPKQNYEISLEARRTNGFDFFCGLTLPSGDQRFSLVLGGWGGSLVGISSIGGMDAANNETMLIREFEQNRWYKIRMRVTDKKLVAWLDDDEIIEFERDERPLDIRAELEESTPVGIAAFQCESEIRNVRVRELTAP